MFSCIVLEESSSCLPIIFLPVVEKLKSQRCKIIHGINKYAVLTRRGCTCNPMLTDFLACSLYDPENLRRALRVSCVIYGSLTRAGERKTAFAIGSGNHHSIGCPSFFLKLAPNYYSRWVNGGTLLQGTPALKKVASV